MACCLDDDAGLNKERNIQFFLEAFKDYIQGCLKADCMNVILKYTEFTVGMFPSSMLFELKNIMAKCEIAYYEQFFLSPQFSQNSSTEEVLKYICLWEYILL